MAPPEAAPLPVALPLMLPALPPLLAPPLPNDRFGDPPAAGASSWPLLPCAGGTPVREAASSLLPGVRPPSRDAASPLRPGERDCCCCWQVSSAVPVRPSHDVLSLVVPAVPLRVPVLLPSPEVVPEPAVDPAALPLPVAPLLVAPEPVVPAAPPLVVPEPVAPLVVPVLLPLPERLVLLLTSPLAEPLADPDALPVADPLVDPLVVPPVVPLRLSAANNAAENASDTAAAIASMRCLMIIGTPFERKMRDKCARELDQAIGVPWCAA